jgi:galactose oxidase
MGHYLGFPFGTGHAFLNPITQKLIIVAADQADQFGTPGPTQRLTFSATWDPEQGIIEQKILRDSQHDIFCPGTSFDESGRVILTGGSTPKGVSIYEPNDHTWSNKDKAGNVLQLKIARGYQGQTYLPNGKTFLIGGMWSGGPNAEAGYRDGELYDPATGWTILTNVKANRTQMDAVISKLPACDPPVPDEKCTMTEWQQHHPWLFAWKGDSIFHAGPSKKMHWIFPTPPDGELKDG